MQRKLQKIFLIIFFIFSGVYQEVFAEECPDFSKISLTSDEAISKIQTCIDARNNGTTNSITEFSCPAGEYSWEGGRPLGKEQLSYLILTNLLMNEVDKKTKDYMKELQDSRNKDALAWTENVRTCILGSADNPNALRYVYQKICTPKFIIDFINNNSTQKSIINTTTGFPDNMCNILAEKKINGWRNLANNLMQDGINKSYQNDSDEFLTRVQGAYRRVLDKFHLYQRIIARAVSKIDAYIRNAVK